MANEFDLELLPGESWRDALASEPCRKRLRVRNPPRLARPPVEVELRALPLPRVGGVGGVISSDGLPTVLIVEALSRRPSLLGGAMLGDDLVEAAEFVES